MNLSLFILIPLLTAVLALVARKSDWVRQISFAGSLVQVILSILLYVAYTQERAAGVLTPMLFEQQWALFPSLRISFHLGVDGISVAMILLTSFVVLAGVLVSWKVEKMTREFYALLLLLALGAYGFFISLGNIS